MSDTRIVTFTTDFGLDDPFVGIMHGVVFNIHPQATVVDVCHAVASYDVFDGAWTIARAYRFFPPRTVHVVVIDPGVGGKRRPIVVDINGCKMLDLPTNLSGDSLSYMVGPRWTPSTSGRWNTHAQLLVGGTKLTQERLYPELKAEVIAAAPPADQGYPLHHLYTKNWDTNGFAIAAGTGVDYKINNALAFRVASLEYSHSWTQELNGVNYQNGLQLTTGSVLRMGRW